MTRTENSMNSITKSTRRRTIALALPRSLAALLSYAQGIVTRMTGNPSFPAPVATLAIIMTIIDDLQTAETAAGECDWSQPASLMVP
jgi:hypothetical protein